MLKLFCDITIKNLHFDYVHRVEVQSGWEKQTDTATLILPSNLKTPRNRFRELLSPGDAVSIRAGYNGRLHPLFTGYVTGLSPRTPLEIYCEDEMWKLKQSTITDSLQNASLQTLLDKHFASYRTNILNTQIGNYQIDKLSRAKVLERIKEQFGLYGFFRRGVLVVGKPYDPETTRRATFRFHYNIIDDELEYKRKEDIRLLVTAISHQPGGHRLEVRLGDPEGEQRSLNFYNLSKDELEKAAQRERDRLLYDGYRGTFTAFGEPFVRHGDIVRLEHPEESDRAGSYWVDAVDYEFGINGYRQIIKLGPRAA